MEPAARAMGQQIQVLNVRTSHEIDNAFESFASERPDALFVGGEAFLDSRRLSCPFWRWPCVAGGIFGT